MITSQDIRAKTFEKAVFGGYEMGSVDDYLEAVAQELDAQAFLQSPYLLGDSGLGEVILGGGFGKAALLRHGNKVFQLVDVHKWPLNIRYTYFNMKNQRLQAILTCIRITNNDSTEG